MTCAIICRAIASHDMTWHRMTPQERADLLARWLSFEAEESSEDEYDSDLEDGEHDNSDLEDEDSKVEGKRLFQMELTAYQVQRVGEWEARMDEWVWR